MFENNRNHVPTITVPADLIESLLRNTNDTISHLKQTGDELKLHRCSPLLYRKNEQLIETLIKDRIALQILIRRKD